MIWWGIIATAIAVIIGLVANAFRQKAKMQREQNDRLRTRIAETELALTRQIEEVVKREHIIKRMQEVGADAAKQKREIRNHTDSTDRAHAATDAMSKLSRAGDDHRNGDGTPAKG